MKMMTFSFNYHSFCHFQTPPRWAWFVSCVLALLLWSYLSTSSDSISVTPKLQQRVPPPEDDSRKQLPSMAAPSHNQVPLVGDTAAPSHNQVPLVEDSHWGQLHCQEKDFLLYAYSAFYDDRDQKKSLYIRVVASSENPEGVSLSCLMFYSEQVQPEVATPLYKSVQHAKEGLQWETLQAGYLLVSPDNRHHTQICVHRVQQLLAKGGSI